MNTAHDKAHLMWHEEGHRNVFDSRIFTVRESLCRSPEGVLKPFTVIDAPDWAIILPVLEQAEGKVFVMVRQWRHGSQELSLEFPGGVFEAGENGDAAAARELREETGYSPGTIRKLGEMSPNPAIMSNRVHFYLAEDLSSCGAQDLDEDEYVEVALIPVTEVEKAMGHAPYVHALMASALMFYRQGVGN